MLVRGLRKHWAEIQIIFRGDYGFYTPLLLSRCERQEVKYVIGFGGNTKLQKHYLERVGVLSTLWETVEKDDPEHEGLKFYYEQSYLEKSWKCSRRVIAKLEHNVCGANQRYIVTNLSGDAEMLYTQLYWSARYNGESAKRASDGVVCRSNELSVLVE